MLKMMEIKFPGDDFYDIRFSDIFRLSQGIGNVFATRYKFPGDKLETISEIRNSWKTFGEIPLKCAEISHGTSKTFRIGILPASAFFLFSFSIFIRKVLRWAKFSFYEHNRWKMSYNELHLRYFGPDLNELFLFNVSIPLGSRKE